MFSFFPIVDRFPVDAINHLNEADEDFKWRWRIIESATWKLPELHKKDRKKALDLERRVKYLQEWCQNRIEEYLENKSWEESWEENPYQYAQELMSLES